MEVHLYLLLKMRISNNVQNLITSVLLWRGQRREKMSFFFLLHKSFSLLQFGHGYFEHGLFKVPLNLKLLLKYLPDSYHFMLKIHG